MACEHGSNRIAALAGRIGAGVSQLAGKRGFYAGLALGGAGLVGAGLLALARRRSDPRRRTTRASPGAIPQLPARQKIEPAKNLAAAERCAGCQTPARGGKAGPWYQIAGRAYCQDCAPTAARQADVDLVAPKVTYPGFSGEKGAVKVTSAASSAPTRTMMPLPVERRVEVRLAPSRLRVYGGQNEANRAVYIEIAHGYAVTRPDYRTGGLTDTGLAVAPGLKLDESKTRVMEDDSQWYLVHLASGKSLPGAQYATLEQARVLAGVLAQLDWTRPEGDISTEDIRRAGATISRYNAALTTEMKSTQPTTAPVKEEPPAVTTPAVAQPLSLTGKLVADPKGGVARVIEDNGDTLFMVDSLGERYEVTRREIQPPSLGDYEGSGVAMSFDPAGKPGQKCARCGQGTENAPAGSKWHVMGWQPFCERCGPAHAEVEGYTLEAEVGVEL